MSLRLSYLLFLFLPCGPLVGQTGQAPTFKRNHLGMTVAEFIRRPAIAEMIAKCKDLSPGVLTDDEVLKKYGKKAFPKIQAAELQAHSIGAHAKGYWSSDVDVYMDRCAALSDVIGKGNGAVNGLGYSPGNAYALNLARREMDQIGTSQISVVGYFREKSK